MRIHFFTAPFYFAFIWFRVQGSGLSWRLRRKYTYDDTRSPFSPSFLWKEVPRRGGGWPRVTVLPHSGANPASLRSSAPSRGRGANDFLGNTDPIVVIRGQGLALPHICRALFRFPHLSFMPPVPYPPLRGTFPSRGRLTI